MLPDLGVHRLQLRSNLALLGRRANTSAARSGSSSLPLRELLRVRNEALGQLRERLV